MTDAVATPTITQDRRVGDPAGAARALATSRRNRINVLWEVTQAFLAMTLTLAAAYSAVVSTRAESETLKNALFVVLGFYFGRTNHSRPTPTDTNGNGDRH